MTQYLFSVHTVEGAPARPTDEIQKAYRDVATLNTELQAAGAWVFGGGLHPLDTATVVQAQSGDALITDGPFTEGKEHLGGFWVIEAPDIDAALAWATKASRACGEPVEVRAFQED